MGSNNMSKLQLVLPSEKFVASYLSFIAEMRNLRETIWDVIVPAPDENDEQFVSRLLMREVSPTGESVAETTYWAVRNNQVEGRISIRHELNRNLEEFGGHIGYEVRPSSRKQGLATEMLKLILQTPKARSIGRLLLTCAPDNVASNRTIVKNGGVLAGSAYVERVERQTNYYWIELK